MTIPSNAKPSRRQFLRSASGAAALAGAAPGSTLAQASLIVDPTPLFEISPWLYMQFLEPLGTTDSSVEAAWDYDADDWRKDFLQTVKDLAPGAIRFGGLYSRHYKWRDGIGPADRRPLTRNYFWGGKETNRVGTAEFADLCRRVGAEQFWCVNFLSDGEKRFRQTPEGDRTGDAHEAAEWVSYCNDPDNRERRRNGVREPYNVKLWQLGNETSYGNRTFRRDESIAATITFAKAMRERDPSIKLIGWGDRGASKELWAGELLKQAGEHLDMVAIHLMGQSPRRPDTVLRGLRYQKDPERAWQELIELSDNVETRIAELEQVIASQRSRTGMAVTEGHLSLSPHNANPILHEWLSAGYHARSFNIYQRHGVKIATGADFEGNRWTVNAVMLQTPRGVSYLMPVGSIARLFRKHNGSHSAAVKTVPPGLDVAASRSDGKVYLHVANLNYRESVEATFAVAGMRITGGRVFQIAPPDFREAVGLDQPDVFTPKESAVPAAEPPRWRFPAGAVAAVELEVQGEPHQRLRRMPDRSNSLKAT